MVPLHSTLTSTAPSPAYSEWFSKSRIFPLMISLVACFYSSGPLLLLRKSHNTYVLHLWHSYIFVLSLFILTHCMTCFAPSHECHIWPCSCMDICCCEKRWELTITVFSPDKIVNKSSRNVLAGTFISSISIKIH